MRIVNREQFLALPPNTVFSKYEPCFLGALCIKDINCGEDDFFYVDIANSVDASDTGDLFDKLTVAKDNGSSVTLNFDTVGRDGLFDKGQLFAVWEPEDILGLIKHLLESSQEQILFSTRREIAAQVDEEYGREPSAKVCTLNTVTILHRLGYLKRTD